MNAKITRRQTFAPTVFAIFAFCLAGALSAAGEPRIFTVDNTGGPHADFTDLQEAMDAAEDGDVFHVLGSPIEYGSVTVTRRVHLFGPGYNLPRVYEEGYQDFHEARLGNVEFNPIRTFNPLVETSPAGSSLSGFVVSSVTIRAADVTVQRNRIKGRVFVDRVTVDGEFLELPHRVRVLQNHVITISFNSNYVSHATGHFIANNIVTLSGNTSRTMRFYNAVIRHNTIGNRASLRTANSTVENNLFGSVSNSSRNTIYRNNMVYESLPDDTTFQTENTFSDNQWNLSENNVWYSLLAGTGSFDEQYRLAEGSLAAGAGVDGVDLGAFDGPFPYEISGVPPMPRVKIMAPGPFISSPHSDLTIPIKFKTE